MRPWKHQERWLFESPCVAVGVLEVPNSSRAWGATCCTPDRPQVAFPTRTIRTALNGASRNLTDRVITPTDVMVSTPGWEYRRHLIDERGERSLVFELRQPNPALRAGVGRASAGAFAAALVLVRRLTQEHAQDGLAIEEAALQVVETVIASGEPAPSSAGAARPSTQRAHHDAIQASLAYLDEHAAGSPTIANAARAAHCSPYHFARLFRAHAGQTVTQHVRELRCRRALIDVLDTRDDLAQIAGRHGFADISHLSRSFVAVFASPPSAFRGRRRRRA